MPRRSPYGGKRGQRSPATGGSDRKSTRLNSSHTVISYAVFCLKKKKHTSEIQSHSDIVCGLLLHKENNKLRSFAIHEKNLDKQTLIQPFRTPIMATHRKIILID